MRCRPIRGRGTQLTLADGRTVIDVGAMSANLLGHCHPEVVAAVQAAAESVYVGDMVGYPPREQAVDDILDIAYGGEDWAGSVALFVSSSEAADLGLALAQMLTGREPLVCRRSGYHGGVGLAREVSHHPLWNTSLAALAGGVLARPGYRADARDPDARVRRGCSGARPRLPRRLPRRGARGADGRRRRDHGLLAGRRGALGAVPGRARGHGPGYRARCGSQTRP